MQHEKIHTYHRKYAQAIRRNKPDYSRNTCIHQRGKYTKIIIKIHSKKIHPGHNIKQTQFIGENTLRPQLKYTQSTSQ